jgi:hypothetical protein
MENEPSQPELIIPWWQDGDTISDGLKEPYFLSKGVSTFFNVVKRWLLLPLLHADALTCRESLLELMAWDRDITRFESEPLSLFRKRVKYAAINAKDSGSVVGFQAIFERLGVGVLAFRERESATDWDLCTIEVTDGDISNNGKLIQTLIEQYGRTCRRYSFQVGFKASMSISCGAFSHRFSIYRAQTTELATLSIAQHAIEHQQQVFVASLIS